MPVAGRILAPASRNTDIPVVMDAGSRSQSCAGIVGTWLLLPRSSHGYGYVGKGYRSMRRAQLVSIFSRRRMLGRVALLTIEVLAVLATPSRAPAQDAGVSGIPPGPANARGFNGSISDPSGIGNAAKVPAIPPPTITPVIPPAVSAPVAIRTLPMRSAVKMRRPRVGASRLRGAAARAAIGEQDRLLDRKLSICRGC